MMKWHRKLKDKGDSVNEIYIYLLLCHQTTFRTATDSAPRKENNN
ncbi:hypothetical protein MiAbW_00468 [Microcystis aeruginosa NIES-4325]|uniref:Uncharacterized protein n=1 Tax=Microcystis aeruginosa NIES-4325 TaxID=2569534 RepID=A0A5J4F4P2_MICAE|nr:hypothetical protein MiAbW_00468 [Microcystis aeruginosa NIES-4325]